MGARLTPEKRLQLLQVRCMTGAHNMLSSTETVFRTWWLPDGSLYLRYNWSAATADNWEQLFNKKEPNT